MPTPLTPRSKFLIGLFVAATAVSFAIPARAALVTLTASDATDTSSFSAIGNWSNGAAPSSANTYQVAGFTLRTPASNANQTWAGGTLTLGNGTDLGNLLLRNMGATNVITFSSGAAGDLHMNNGAVNASAVSGGTQLTTTTLAGNIVLDAGGGRFSSAFGTAAAGTNATLNLNANLSGNGALTLTNTNASGNAYTFFLNINGANTNSGLVTIQGNGNSNFKTNITVAASSTLGSGNVTILPGANTALIVNLNNSNTFADDIVLTLGGATTVTNSNLTFNLNYAGGDTIGSLIYNGTTYGAGTYGSAASGAATVLDGFTGTGYLTVVPEPATCALLALGLAGIVATRKRQAAPARQ